MKQTRMNICSSQIDVTDHHDDDALKDDIIPQHIAKPE
jgi:hypothetical protein